MTEFRFRITDIPWNKQIGAGFPGPAQNAGIAQLRCYINACCPFVQVPEEEDVIIFNSRTLSDAILKYFPEDFTSILTTTPRTEGIHFRPKYVYRNIYLYEVDTYKTITKPGFDPFEMVIPGDEISEGRNGVIHVNDTKYKMEQSWKMTESVFDKYARERAEDNNISPENFYNVSWTYSNEEIESQATEQDILNDYTDEVYTEYLNKKNSNLIAYTQILRQTSSLNINDDGVHWKLIKKTPLFKGEDFFFEFYRYPEATSVTTKNKKDNIGEPINFGIEAYYPLDVNNEERLADLRDKQLDGKALKLLDLSDQAYYVIEITNNKDTTHSLGNYFIFICERTSPVFFKMIGSGKTGKVIKLSEFKDIFGKMLIEAKKFRMTVRNHLGKLVIQFDGPTINVGPWIISMTEVYDKSLDQPGQVTQEEVDTPLIISGATLSLWGGNMLCGFTFGPLQYVRETYSFTYPPSELPGSTSTVFLEAGMAPPVPKFFELPIGPGVKHSFKLTSTDEEIEDILEYMTSAKQTKYGEKLFTQDAQYYQEFEAEYDRLVGSGRENRVKDGWFFFREPIRGIGYKTISPATGKVETSSSFIAVQKNSIVNQFEDRIQFFTVLIRMATGIHIFRYSHGRTKKWQLSDCVTPILTSIRLLSSVGTKPRWDDGTTINSGINPIPVPSKYMVEVTDHVMNYSESWTATDFTELEHTGTIKFLINKNIQMQTNVSDLLLSIRNKTFYIDIWAGYENCNYTKIPGFYKLMTGLCYGGETEYLYGRRFMTCKIFDYTKILKDQLMFNCPFYDGVKDCNAVHNILSFAGFRSSGRFDPGFLLKQASDNQSYIDMGIHRHLDGRIYKLEPYALPSQYKRLEQPAFKYADGTSFYEIIKKIAERAGKLFYFDQYGICHYEDFLDMIKRVALGEERFDLLFSFTSNPDLYPGQLIFNKAEFGYDVDSVHNHIKIFSNTPSMELLLQDRMNWSSFDEPDSEGFIGYKKTFYQQEPVFGSEEAVKRISYFYTLFFRPPCIYKFETYGLPLRAGDFISVDGQSVRTTHVEHTLDPETNKWWMTVESERFQPIGRTLD